MAYKKLIKVSNVCQLLDKSKYPATLTNAGVTVTNNGDGTITANGNCTYTLNINLTEINKFTIKAKHKYLILDSSGSTSRTQYSTWVRSEKGGILLDSTSMPIGGMSYNDNKCTVYLRFNNGVSVSNITFKPQLFDLTEMYRAGHEPTTVEQFRQDFPEEMYDYSPHCWLTSYKRVFMTGGGNYLTSYQRNLTCKTKNLFDINSAKKVSGISFSKNGNQITVSQSFAGTWRSANVLLDTSLVGKTITVTAFAMTSGLNKTYIRIQWADNNGLARGSLIESNMISGSSYQKLTLSGVVPESPGGDFTNLCIMFYSNTNNYSLESGVTYSATFTNIQIELGDTATDYVPYGHL